MGNYDRRNKEIDESLKRFIDTEYKKKIEDEKRGGAEVIHATYIRYGAGLQAYHSIREKALEEALKLVKGVSESTKAAEQQEKWRSVMSAAAKQSYDGLTSTFKDRDFDDFKTLIEIVALADSDFYNRMGSIPLVEAQGKVMEYLVQLKEEQKNLERKWDELAGDNASLQKKVNEVTEQLMQVFEKTLKEVQQENRLVGERLAEGVKRAGLDPSKARSEFSTAKAALDTLVASVDGMVPDGETYIQRLKDLYRTNETTVILFTQTRKSVKEFLEQTNLEKAIKMVDDAYKKSLDLANGCYTPALKEDAKYFVDDVYKEVESALDKFEDVYEDFVDKHKGIFIGPVGDRTAQDLVNRERWDWVNNEWKRLNIEGELKKIYDDSSDYWDVSLDGVPELLADEIKKDLKSDLDALSLAVRELTDWTHADAIKFLITDYPRLKLMEILNSFKG